MSMIMSPVSTFNDAAYISTPSIKTQVKKLMKPRMTLAAIIKKLPHVDPESVMAAYDDIMFERFDIELSYDHGF